MSGAREDGVGGGVPSLNSDDDQAISAVQGGEGRAGRRRGEGVTAISLLDECISEWVKPTGVLAGHDSQYYAMRGGKSQFDPRLEKLGIKHILAAMGSRPRRGESRRGPALATVRRGGSRLLTTSCSTTTGSGPTSPWTKRSRWTCFLEAYSRSTDSCAVQLRLLRPSSGLIAVREGIEMISRSQSSLPFFCV